MPGPVARHAVPAAPAGRRTPSGFSMIELLVVVVLIAGVTAIAASVMGVGLAGQQLRGSARELAAQLRYTRAQAIVTGRPQSFVLDTVTREWSAPNRRQGRLPDAIAVVATTARSEQPTPTAAAVRFFPEGASTGGRFVLSRGGAAWQLDVDWLTGEVRMSRAEDAP